MPGSLPYSCHNYCAHFTVPLEHILNFCYLLHFFHVPYSFGLFIIVGIG